MRTGKPFSMPPIRVISPSFASQVESSKSLKEWLRTEETVRGICFSKQMEESMDCSYKSITNCTFSHVQFNNCKLKATHFTHGKIEVSRIAILHPAMIQDCFWQICAYQFTGNEFYPKKRAFCK